jgi:hypothetical protein
LSFAYHNLIKDRCLFAKQIKCHDLTLLLTKCILLEVDTHTHTHTCWISPASILCTHGAIVKLMQVMRSRRPCSATSTLWTEVRVRSRWPVACEGHYRHIVFTFLFCDVWSASSRTIRCKTLRLDVLHFKPLCNIHLCVDVIV